MRPFTLSWVAAGFQREGGGERDFAARAVTPRRHPRSDGGSRLSLLRCTCACASIVSSRSAKDPNETWTICSRLSPVPMPAVSGFPQSGQIGSDSNSSTGMVCGRESMVRRANGASLGNSTRQTTRSGLPAGRATAAAARRRVTPGPEVARDVGLGAAEARGRSLRRTARRGSAPSINPRGGRPVHGTSRRPALR
jgi:hypothetical protein